MLDARGNAGDALNGQHVQLPVVNFVFGGVQFGGGAHVGQLAGRNGFFWQAKAPVAAGFDFYENGDASSRATRSISP